MDSRLTQDLNGALNGAPLLRQKRQRFSFLILFIGIFVFVAAAGALYYALRPETLRIAVGPPDSDDQKLVQALAQSFARQRRDRKSTRLNSSHRIASRMPSSA